MDPKAADLLRRVDDVGAGRDMTPAEKDAATEALDLLGARAPALLQGCPPDDAAEVYRRLAMAESWTDRRPPRGLEWLNIASELATTAELRATLAEERSRLEDLVVLGDLLPLIRAGRVSQARGQLRERLELSGSNDERARIEALLADPRTFAVPVHAAPSMSTINGFGTSLYGKRSARSDGTYIATLYFVILFIPILPIAGYLVRAIHPGWQFFAKVPLTRFQIWWRRVALTAPLLFIGGLWGAYEWDRSPWRRETAAIALAEAALARDDGSTALHILAPLRSRDPARAGRILELGTKAAAGTLDAVSSPGDLQLFLTRDARYVRATWMPASMADRVEKIAVDVARQKNGGPAAADFLRWAQKSVPDFGPRAKAAAEKASDVADDSALDVLALHGPALDRMERRLRAGRFEGWDDHALRFVEAALPERGLPILYLRAERAWKGLEPAGALAALKTLPSVLSQLLQVDEEKILPKKASRLESLESVDGLPEPQASWHRLGVARRLSTTYALLNEADPTAWPIERARRWALKAHELAPADVDLRLRAMRLLIDDGDYAKAVALGELSTGDTRTLVWLGVAYGRSGRPADAARVLRPYVEVNLETYLKSYESWGARNESLRKRLFDSLSNGTAERAILQRLARLKDAEADREADRWVAGKVAADAALQKHEAVWRPIESVYAAALELAMAELALATGAERQLRLREAEKLFVQLRRVSDDPHQELELGRVYFWLGKPAEGQAIFAALEKTGDGDVLLKMGGILRELGRHADARRVLEAAHDRLKGEARFEAAQARASAWKSHEDRLDWLNKCDASSKYVQAELAQVRGKIALRDGRYDEAARELKRTSAYHASLTDDEKSFNNAALVELDLARITGETSRLSAARTLLRRAVDRDPQAGIVLCNYVDALGYLAYGALSKDALQAGVLHSLPNVSWLNWRSPPLTSQDWAAAARAQAEFRQAAEIGARAMILSPENDTGFYAQLYFAWFSRDAAAVRALRTSIEANASGRPPQVDAPDDPKATKQAPAVQDSTWVPRLESARKSGAPPATLAYLLLRVSSTSFKTDPDASLKAALEARALHDCPATRQYLMSLRMSAVARDLSDRDADFKAWNVDDLAEDAALSTYFERHPGKASEFRAREDVKALAAGAEESAALPSPLGIFRTWRLLRLTGSPKEAEAKQAIVVDTILLDVFQADVAQSGGLSDLVDVWEAARLYGDAALADRVAADARRRKLFPPLFGD